MTVSKIIEGHIEWLIGFVDTNAPAKRRLLEISEAVAKLRRECDGRAWHLHECEQIAGKALGYPWYKDDQKNFPGATEADGICIGDHVADSIVAELATAFQATEAKGPAELIRQAFRDGQEHMKARAAAAVAKEDRSGRDWVQGSLWDKLTGEAKARVLALDTEDRAP